MLRSLLFRFSLSFEWPCSYIVADAWTKKERYSVCNVKVSQLWALIEREDFQSLRLSCEPIAPTLSPPSFLSFQSSPTLQKVLHYHSFKYIFSLLFLFKPPSRLPSPPVRNKGINPPADQWIPCDIQISYPPTLKRADTALTRGNIPIYDENSLETWVMDETHTF